MSRYVAVSKTCRRDQRGRSSAWRQPWCRCAVCFATLQTLLAGGGASPYQAMVSRCHGRVDATAPAEGRRQTSAVRAYVSLPWRSRGAAYRRPECWRLPSIMRFRCAGRGSRAQCLTLLAACQSFYAKRADSNVAASSAVAYFLWEFSRRR